MSTLIIRDTYLQVCRNILHHGTLTIYWNDRHICVFIVTGRADFCCIVSRIVIQALRKEKKKIRRIVSHM